MIPPPISVLVVDDSVVFRNVLSNIVASDPDLRLLGCAPNGSVCLQKVQQLNPDVIILDLEMPEMDGFEVLRRVGKSHPNTRVIVFSAHSEKGADQTFEAIRLGAADFAAKGLNLGGAEASKVYIREQLLPKIKQFRSPGSAARFSNSAMRTVTSPAPALPTSPLRRRNKLTPRVLAIGCSTGGPNALGLMLPMLPADFPLPIVIVQHMPPLFTKLMAERLDAASKIHVEEAREGSELVAGNAYVAPGGSHLSLKQCGQKVVCVIDQGPPENSCKPSVDVLFRSVAAIYGGATIAVILTGMGRDGFLGTQLLKANGATVIAQDKASSVVWGMPGIVVESKLADVVAPIQSIATEVEKCLPIQTIR